MKKRKITNALAAVFRGNAGGTGGNGPGVL